jgi:Glycosidases
MVLYNVGVEEVIQFTFMIKSIKGETNMNIHAIYHEAKSKYAYAFDKDTVHIRLRTAKGDISYINMVWGDPFNWRKMTEAEMIDHQSQNENPDFTKRHTWASDKDSPMAMVKDYSDHLYDYWFIEIKPEFKRTRYGFELFKKSVNGEERFFYGAHGAYDLSLHPEMLSSLNDFFNFPYLNEEDVFSAPSWVKDTVWYQIFPERFANGDPSLNKPHALPWGSHKEVTNEMHFGGDLQGIISKLDYIKDLGATGIYFTPIFEAPTTHKYDTIDYFKIDPEFGTNEAFKTLVDEAHKRGIRVMLDAVFNHCGFKHPFFQDVVKNGMDSEYAQCFHLIKEPVINFPINDKGFPAPTGYMAAGALNYETFAFTPNMPKWRTGNPVAERYLLDVAEYWIREYDIDGWRLDVSNEVSHVFWRKFKKAVRAIKPDLFILGENWDDSTPWLRGDQFDSVMNYEFTYPVWHLLSREAIYKDFGVEAFKANISRLLVSYPKNIAINMFNLLDSHDTSRLHTLLGEDERLVKIAFLLQMSFGGSPSVYYGSEIGLFGVHDGNRQCMIWDEAEQNLGLKAHVKQMIALRNQYPAMKEMDMKFISYDQAPEMLIYSKEYKGETLTFIINLEERKQTISLKSLDHNLSEDVYSGYKLSVDEQASLVLDAFSFRILK